VTIADLKDWVLTLGAVAAALAAIGIVLRVAVVRPLQNWLRDQVAGPVADIHHEVKPDHGGSMREDVTDLRDGVAVLQTTMDAHLKETNARGYEIAEIRARLEDHIRNHPGPGGTDGH
jgi:hypothetical protein